MNDFFLKVQEELSRIEFNEITVVTFTLFSVIDIIGSIPLVIDLRKKTGHIQSEKATLVSIVLMFLFLFFGEGIIKYFGADLESFSITGAMIIILLGFEMVLGIVLFKDNYEAKTSSIVPLAFPIIAGAGSMTVLLSLRAKYALVNVSISIFINMLLVYIVLKSSGWIEEKLGVAGANILRKVFGIILLAIGIKMFKDAIVSIIKEL